MKNKSFYRLALWIVVNASRMILAASLIFSGLVKIVDPRGTEYKIRDYSIAFGLQDMMWLHLPLFMSMALAIVEFCLGVNLLFGNNRRWTTRVVLLFFLLFTPFTLYLALENPVHDCGCFGDAWVITNWQSFYKNLLLLLCSIVACRWYRLHTRIISEVSQWLITLYSWLFALVLACYCTYTLPVMDFRPYHIGADLHAQMQWNDNPDYVPPITDLFITHPLTGQDMTDSIISSPGWKFLIVMPRIEYADDGVMDKLAELTDYCRHYGYSITALTASSDSLVHHWQDITGAEYPFMVADEIPLKTMVRSNPGVILLHGSTVANKWASTQIPHAAMLTAPLEHLSWAHRQQSSYWQRSATILAWYVIPLCLWTLVDRLRTAIQAYRRRKERAHTLK